jgi:hypothetical protein
LFDATIFDLGSASKLKKEFYFIRGVTLMFQDRILIIAVFATVENSISGGLF